MREKLNIEEVGLKALAELGISLLLFKHIVIP